MDNQNYQQPQQPQQPMYQPQPVYAPVTTVAPGKGLATASLVLGIVSFFLFPVICGPLAIVFGIMAKKQGNTSGVATAGIVTGIIGLVLWIIMLVFVSSFYSRLFSFL